MLRTDLVQKYIEAACAVHREDRRRAAAWWRNMRRSSIPIAHIVRRRILGAGFRMVDILLLAGERQGLPFFAESPSA